jgi:hypothetical protein
MDHGKLSPLWLEAVHAFSRLSESLSYRDMGSRA